MSASADELDLLNRLDRIFAEHPVYGRRRLQVTLAREGISVGRRRIRRLMRTGALRDQTESQHQQAASGAQDLSWRWSFLRPGRGRILIRRPDAIIWFTSCSTVIQIIAALAFWNCERSTRAYGTAIAGTSGNSTIRAGAIGQRLGAEDLRWHRR
jgi:transposase InsO family protein